MFAVQEGSRMLLFQNKISISYYETLILSPTLLSSWQMVWRCLSNHRAYCLFLLLPGSHKPKNWNQTLLMVQLHHGVDGTTWQMPLQWLPPCLLLLAAHVRAAAEGAGAQQKQLDSVALCRRAFTLPARGRGRNRWVLSNQSLVSDLPSLPSSDISAFVNAPSGRDFCSWVVWVTGFVTIAYCVGHGPTEDIAKGSHWCCNTLGLLCNVPVELR